MKNKSSFPVSKTYQESISLKAPKERYDAAKSSKRAAILLASMAGLAMGADVLHDGDIGPVSFVASGVLGAASSAAFRGNREQRIALSDAQSVVLNSEQSLPKPTDINIRYN